MEEKMKSKLQTLMVGLTVIGLVIISCFPATGKVTTIKMWHYWGGIWGEYQQKITDMFMEECPEIKVETLIIPWGDFYPKLLSSIGGGVGPDVAIMDGPWMPTYAHKGVLMPLDEFIARDRDEIQPEDYYPVTWEESTYEGKVYGAYYVGGVTGLFWNKDLFKEVGLNPNTSPQTWKEMDEYSEKLTRMGPREKYERIGFIPWQSVWNGFFTWAWINQGKFYDAETKKITAADPKNVEALEWVVSYGRKYDPEKIATFQSGWGEWYTAMNPFIQGELAMVCMGNWEMTTIRDFAPKLDYGIASMPISIEGVRTTGSGGAMGVIPVGSKKIEEAWEFIKWLTINGSDLRAIMCNDQPYRWSSFQNPEVTENKKMVEFMKMMPTAKCYPVIPVLQMYIDEVKFAYESAYRLKKAPKEALEEVQKKIQQELDRVLRK